MGFIEQLKIAWKLKPQRVNKLFMFILEHTEKKCPHCDKQYGIGLDIPVMDIVQHMAKEHPEKIDMKEAESYIKTFS